MKNDKKLFIIAETVLAIGVVALAVMMIKEKNREVQERVSVIIQNSDDGQWSSFKYGLKMAAQDHNVELFIVATPEDLTVSEEKVLIENEISLGADAVIVDPVLDKDVVEMLQKIRSKVPVIVVEDISGDEGMQREFPIACADNETMGKDLAKELLDDYNGDLSGKKLGIFMHDFLSAADIERCRGFENAIKNSGGEIVWIEAASQEQSTDIFLESLPQADLIVALDDYSLTAAGRQNASNNLHGARVYGIGSSTEALYYLDSGIIDCVVVPDDFRLGYESLAEITKSLNRMWGVPENITVSHTVIRRETLFTEENQEIIFTMSQ